ncbi:MAG TPA: enoyl-CoA hydratase/isomerase family protein [Acidimicrobiales bacterium]|nr:enoyl-CoA hydratase/isomerase family protein [Acidimicrobiales bacterium]
MSEPSYREFRHLAFSRPSPGVVLVTIDRPERLNAANLRLHRELAEVWPVLDGDDTVRASVVTGAGRAFSAGGDLDMIREMSADYATLVTVWQDAADLVTKIVESRKPIVSAINGSAVGAGLVVALLADVSIAGENVRLSDGHGRLGVAAGDHAVLLWPLLCGLAKAKYYLLTAEPVTGREAERLGLVSRCVPDDQVLEEALAVASRLAAGSATAVQWTKRALNNWLRQALPSFGEALALEMLGFLGPDLAEGLAALAGRRDPAFPSARPPAADAGSDAWRAGAGE